MAEARTNVIEVKVGSQSGFPKIDPFHLANGFVCNGFHFITYGTRLGDLKENWFLLFSNLTLNTHMVPPGRAAGV